MISPRALCLDPRLSLDQYIHSNWTEIDGALLPTVYSLAQTKDGYLWLGTAEGLIRFDGLKFRRWKPREKENLPDEFVTSLTASAGGGLWIGTRKGISLLRAGHLTNLTKEDGIPEGVIVAMEEDRKGRLWAGTARSFGLILVENGKVKIFGEASGLPSLAILSFYRDRSDALWIGTDKGACRWTGSAATDCAAESHGLRIQAMTGDDSGKLTFLGTIRGFLQLPDRTVRPLADEPQSNASSVKTLLRDRDGSIWAGTFGRGIFRTRNGKVEHFARRDGLANDRVTAMLEDHEGTIWVGTPNGLDQFRDPRVARLSTVQGLSGNVITAVCATHDGAIWVAATDGGLNRLQGGAIRNYSSKDGVPGATVSSLYEDPSGALWAGGNQGLAYFADGRFREVRMPDGSSINRVSAITGGVSGEVWLADDSRGLLHVRSGRVEASGLNNVPGGASIYQLYTDRSGNLWIGTWDRGVALAAGEDLKFYDSQSGLASAKVHAIFGDTRGSIWIGTDKGLSRFRNGRWTSWTSAEGLTGSIDAITEDGTGSLWLITSKGLVPLELDKLERSPDGRPEPLSVAPIGLSDGIRFDGLTKKTSPHVTRGTDGVLWFRTEDGVASIYPPADRVNRLPPPVAIETFSVDGKAFDTGSPISLRGKQFQFEYTALSLTLPERVRFRYRLDGVDHDWVETTTRQIAYANLAPGRYSFHLKASNSDGMWGSGDGLLDFRVEPFFYQTWYFAIACLAGTVLVALAMHRLRLQQLQSRFRLVLQERARLSREMHDTLLQGFAGVTFQLEAATRQIDAAPEAAKERIDRALDQADQSLKEARYALSCMRLEALENSTLPEAVKAAAKQIADGTSIPVSVQVEGRVRQLPYDIQANLYTIAREAVNNAVNHAKPRRVIVELSYASNRVRLAVSDDGIGFDPSAPVRKGNHWGLSGMRERAKQIGAEFQIASQPGHGTKLVIIAEFRSDSPRPASLFDS